MDVNSVKRQVSAPMTKFMGADVFEKNNETAIYWLGSGGIFINSHGTTIMVDPVIETDPLDETKSEAGYRYLVPPPITTKAVPKLDAVLYTHADYDHMAPVTAKGLEKISKCYYGTERSAHFLVKFGVSAAKIQIFGINETFEIGELRIRTTVASHSWQKNRPEYDWYYGPEDCCGFLIQTLDGTVWIPGDSILMQEHFKITEPVDCMFFDVSSDPFHFGADNAILLANHYHDADLLLYHYGTYDAPEKLPFNADPSIADGKVQKPERLHVIAPGEKFILSRKNG